MKLLVILCGMLSTYVGSENITTQNDLIKEIRKMFGRLSALEKVSTLQQAANEKLKSQMEGLKERLGVQRMLLANHSKSTADEIKGLEKKQRKQEEVVNERIVKVDTEIQGLKNKQRKQEEVVKERTTKVNTEIQVLEKKQRVQEEVVKERTAKVDTEIQELRKETSLGLGIECDPAKVVYFPRDTTTHKMQQCYTFNNGIAPYYLHFVGYGTYGTSERYERLVSVSFTSCVTSCEAKRKEDIMWNGMAYVWSDSLCLCLHDIKGFDPGYKSSDVLYAFTS